MSRTARPAQALEAKQRVEEGLEALRVGLIPYVARHMRDRHGPNWRHYARRRFAPGTWLRTASPLDARLRGEQVARALKATASWRIVATAQAGERAPPACRMKPATEPEQATAIEHRSPFDL
ncbi:MAG: hypothetical protein OXU81_01800 [Gammaproteobacteria bacterium]|nr:hypothetical protein [Gammaproteobacteria bacterium]